MNNSNNNYTFQISAGRGPAECCWAVAQLLRFITKQLNNQGIAVSVTNQTKGKQRQTLESVTLALKGKDIPTLLAPWLGTIKWEGKSPFRPNHKRTNWYIATALQREDSSEVILQAQDLIYQTFRASGAGGQHVNKTESAVRVIHQPTQIMAESSDQRSQHQNKKVALQRLQQKLADKALDQQKAGDKRNWQLHTNIERGNEVAIFKGLQFKLKG